MTDALDSKIRAFLVELVDAAPSPPEFDAIPHEQLAEAISTTRRSVARRLVPALVAIAVAIGAGVAFVAARGDDPAIHPAQATPQEVALDAIPPADASLVVFMDLNASDAQFAAVHNVIASSPEVQQFASGSREDEYRELTRIYAECPDRVQSFAPKDLPESFRLIGVPHESLAALRTTLTLMPGVNAVNAADATQADQTCGTRDSTNNASPAPPTLPETDGPEPVDPVAARTAVINAFTQAFTGTNSAAQRRAAMQDGTGLATALDQARAQFPETVDSMSIEINDLRLLDATRAAVIYTVTLDGTQQGPIVGYAVRDGDQWKVSRHTMCQALILAAVDCPS